MKDLSSHHGLIGDIEALIDEALAHPDRAGQVKARIVARIAHDPRSEPPRESDDGEEEDALDLWDNLPI